MTANRNPGIPLDAVPLAAIRINTPAVEKRCAEITARRSVKNQYQAAWLLKAVSLLDLTTLSGADTPARVQRLCGKALHPIAAETLHALAYRENLHTAAVCVYHEMIPAAVAALKNRLPIAAVSTGFPAGLSSAELRQQEISASVDAGAREIDVVLSRRYVFAGDWASLYAEIKAYRQRCGDAHLKVILATGDLQSLRNVALASWVAMAAGADFIKTSTGKEAVNATLPVCLTMARAIRDYHRLTGAQVGFKPAGGISNTKQALAVMVMIKEELGNDWLQPSLLRFGASSLLLDIERQLFHAAFGTYSANWRHPVA